MHTVALFSKAFYKGYMVSVDEIMDKLALFDTDVYMYLPLYQYLTENGHPPVRVKGFFSRHSELPPETDFLISLGGDGTLLTALSMVRDSGIPIAGINSGRLGFLSSTSQAEYETLLDGLNNGTASIEERSLIEWVNEEGQMGPDGYNVALNEITLQKFGTPLMTTHVYYNQEFLNSYFSDGVIMATPTGSTAYSLSTGGPILTPDAKNFIISPICPHNLNVRPLVIPDSVHLMLRTECRNKRFIITLDSFSLTCDSAQTIQVRKAPFSLRLVKPSQGYFATLRDKLMWGADARRG